jgi:hypothetical protein
MTIGKYISNVRIKLSDAVAPYRVSDEKITDALQEALRRARQMRPSLCYAGGVLLPEASDVNFAAPVSTAVRAELDSYSEGLVFIAAARILADDNADTLNLALSDKWQTRGTEILAI